MKWKTKDGRELSPSQMDEAHINNCLNGLRDGRLFGEPLVQLTTDPDDCPARLPPSWWNLATVQSLARNVWIRRFEKELSRRYVNGLPVVDEELTAAELLGLDDPHDFF